MTQVDQSVDDVVGAEEVGGFAVKTDEQGTELVDPGEGPFAGEALLVDVWVEEAFSSAFVSFA